MHINLASWTCTVEDHLLWFKEDFTGTHIFTRFVGYYVTLIFQFPIYLEPGTSYVGLPGSQRFQRYRDWKIIMLYRNQPNVGYQVTIKINHPCT